MVHCRCCMYNNFLGVLVFHSTKEINCCHLSPLRRAAVTSCHSPLATGPKTQLVRKPKTGTNSTLSHTLLVHSLSTHSPLSPFVSVIPAIPSFVLYPRLQSELSPAIPLYPRLLSLQCSSHLSLFSSTRLPQPSLRRR